MTYKSTSKILIASVLLFAVLVTVCFPILANVTPGIAFATDNFSAVLDDLKSDPAFDESKYTENKTDYSVNVIQIAEGVHGNVFIYTYQPCAVIRSLIANKVNMSLSEEVNGTKLYDLNLISKEGVFAKYEVKGLSVSKTATRYYNISTIYRTWIPGVDEKADADKNVINSVAYPVGQVWTAKTSGDTVKYDMHEIEVVTITSQMIGFRRYSDGFQFANTKTCDAHFMAFTCDHDIDFLLSADIEFVTTSYKKLEGSDYKYDTPNKQKVTLESYQVASNDGSGWFGKKEEWHRMTSTREFVSEVSNMSKEEKDILLKYDWILNFYETDYICDAGGKDILIALLVPFGFIGLIVDAVTTRGTFVSDVTLLRLEFAYDGDIYNLGVVADSQAGDRYPTNGGEDADFNVFGKIGQWFKDTFSNPGTIFKIICIALAVIIAIVLIVLVVSLLKNRSAKIIVKGSKKSRKSKKSRR